MNNRSALPLTAALALAATSVFASPKDFATTYNATSLPKGTFEFEHALLWNHFGGSDGLKFEHELEYGVTDRWQLAALAKWEYERADGEGSDSAFTSAGIESLYQVLNPNKDPIGLAVVLEAAIGDEEAALEGKIFLQKNVGDWMLNYNVSLESVWAGDNYGDEKVAEFQQSAAIGYRVTPQLTVGVEAVQAGAWLDWSEKEENALFVGPSVAFKQEHFWFAIGAQFQVTNDEASPDMRGVVEVGFLF